MDAQQIAKFLAKLPGVPQHARDTIIRAHSGRWPTGEARGKAKSLLNLLEARGIAVSAAMRTKIRACTSSATLDRWQKNALHASSASEVLTAS